MHGIVKWFDEKKGFGFITSDDEVDIFVHHSDIGGKGFKTLNQGDEVSFIPAPGKKGEKATKVEVVSANRPVQIANRK